MDCLNIFKDEQEYAQAISEHPEIFFDKPTVTAITEELKPTKCYIEPLVTGKTGRPDAAGLKGIGWSGNDIMRLHRDLDTFVDVPQSDKDLLPMDKSKISSVQYTMKYCPMFDTSEETSMRSMFFSCEQLISVPKFDTSKVTNMSKMFGFSAKPMGLKSVPYFDTSKVTNMSYMFQGCRNITSIPHFDTSKVTDMSYMFSGCSSLTSVPQFDTSKVTNMSKMFGFSAEPMGLKSVPYFDTSKVTDMSYMFQNCSSLTSVPQFDTSKVTDMSWMFQNCSSLTSVPQFDTSNVTTMNNILYAKNSISSFEADGKITHDIDTDKITLIKDSSYNWIIHNAKYFYLKHQPNGGFGWVEGDISNVLDNGDSFTISIGSWHGPQPEQQVHKEFKVKASINNLIYLGGFKGLKCSLDLSYCPNLTKQSLMNVINNAASGVSGVTLTLGAANHTKLTAEEIAIATNKGWTISI